MFRISALLLVLACVPSAVRAQDTAPLLVAFVGGGEDNPRDERCTDNLCARVLLTTFCVVGAAYFCVGNAAPESALAAGLEDTARRVLGLSQSLRLVSPDEAEVLLELLPQRRGVGLETNPAVRIRAYDARTGAPLVFADAAGWPTAEIDVASPNLPRWLDALLDQRAER